MALVYSTGAWPAWGEQAAPAPARCLCGWSAPTRIAALPQLSHFAAASGLHVPHAAPALRIISPAQEDAAKKKAEEAEAAAKGEEASSSETAAAEVEVKELLAEATAAADKEEAKEAKEGKEAAEAASSSGGDEAQVKSLEKAQTAAAKRASGEDTGAGAVMKSQKDITLAKDLDLRDR